jgi:four helix bundle protein
MKINSYKDLDVWKKSMILITEVYSVSQTFLSNEMYGLISQIRRASCSVSLNIAEGWGRSSTKNYIQFLRISKGSLMEVENCILISQNLSYISVEKADLLFQQIDEISRMLNGLIKALKNKIITETSNQN